MQGRHFMSGTTYNESASINSDITADIDLSSEVLSSWEEGNDQGISDVVPLLHTKRQRIKEIVEVKQKESEALKELSKCKKQYSQLQECYQQVELSIQSAVVQNSSEECVWRKQLMIRTVVKIQELRNLMKFLESLNQHRYSNKQFYEEDLHSLHEQADSKKALVQHEQEQYWLIVGIEEKVNQSLSSLLSIYRSINLDILQCQCFLEKIPSKSELLFVALFCLVYS